MNHEKRRGYTLLEMVISSAVMSIIMGAMVATMLIASRSINSSPGQTLSDAGNVVDHVTTDLSLAQSFSERQANAVTVTVPDRDGDSQPEIIRYSWSGQAGDPLLRTYNGQDAVVVASNVHNFDLSYLTKTIPAGGNSSVSPEVEGEVKTLIQHDNAPGGWLGQYRITSTKWCAQYFAPTLVGEATKWKITQVMFNSKRSGSGDGVIRVQIRTANSSWKPTSTVLAETTVKESSWGTSYAWRTVDIGPISNLDPNKGYCLVLKYVSGSGEVARIRYETGGRPMTAYTNWMTTSNRGSSWSNPEDRRDMWFKIIGTVTTRGL